MSVMTQNSMCCRGISHSCCQRQPPPRRRCPRVERTAATESWGSRTFAAGNRSQTPLHGSAPGAERHLRGLHAVHRRRAAAARGQRPPPQNFYSFDGFTSASARGAMDAARAAAPPILARAAPSGSSSGCLVGGDR